MKNGKKLEDYMHLYIGCECMEDGNKGTLYATGMLGGDGQHRCLVDCSSNESYWTNIHNIKPILRTLSDVTDDELADVVLLIWMDSRDIAESMISKIKRRSDVKMQNKFGTSIPYTALDKKGDHFLTATLSSNQLNPQQFIYLLKRGFDLFGLIPEFAIDKATMKQDNHKSLS